MMKNYSVLPEFLRFHSHLHILMHMLAFALLLYLTFVLGRREADIRNKFSLPAHLTMGKFIEKTYSLKVNNLLETSASIKRITISVIPFGYPSSRVDVYFLICF